MKTNNSFFSRALLPLSAVALALTVTGCLLFPARRQVRKSDSVVAFLFPSKQPDIQLPSLPTLNLPLRVGIAFVPEERNHSQAVFSEMQKQVLMKRVADQFRSLAFVQAIEVVPGAYLRPGGSFENLEQLRSLLGIDVIVLVSFDQVQFTEPNIFSLAYWTIVGAYVINGNRNDTHTLMEATVYDISSRALLFRAPGVDQTKASTSGAYVDAELRKDSAASLDRATTDLIKNLDTALGDFRTAVKEGRGQVQIAHKPGYTGGGAIDRTTATVILLVFIIVASLWARKQMARTGRDQRKRSPEDSD